MDAICDIGPVHDLDMFRKVIEDMPIGVIVLDNKGKVMVMNRRQEEISKVEREQVLGTFFHHTWRRLFEAGIYGDHYWNLINKRIPFSFVFHEVAPQFYNHKVTGVSHGVPLSGGDGCVLIHDISEEMQRDKSSLERLANQLQETTAFLTNLIDSSPNGVIVADEAGLISFTNETITGFFDYPRAGLIGKQVTALFSDPVDLAQLACQDGTSTGFEAVGIKRDGTPFPAKILFNRFSKGLHQAPSFLFLIRDITNEREMARSMEERLNFELLLSELSATFVNLPIEKIDAEINHGLERICRFLRVERAGLFQFSPDNEVPYLSHTWWAEGFQMASQLITLNDFPYIFGAVQRGEVIRIRRPDDIPETAVSDRNSFLKLNAHSYLGIPLIAGSANFGQLGFGTVANEQSWPDELVQRLRLIGETFANALLRKRSEENLKKAFCQIKLLKDKIEAERNYLREEIKLAHNFEEIIGNSSSLQYALYKVEQVAPTGATVLIQGETGTGKELIARAIHHASPRKEMPLIKVNCATLPATLIESELFGHEKGAFTGAQSVRPGRFELADQSTIFLDEIGEMPLELQPKLLRVLQEGAFERLGGSRTMRADVRVIAATNRNLEQEVQRGRFRKDLWYRLNVFPITVPPLRDRQEDIPILVNWFVKRFCKKLGKTIQRIDTLTMNKLLVYPWPGNVRELENVIERLAIKTKGEVLYADDEIRPVERKETGRYPWRHLNDMEHEYISMVLKETNWRISGKKGAALILGLNPNTLRGRMRKLNIRRQ